VDLSYWHYLEQAHPVYDRPPEAERWEFATPGLTPAPYEVPPEEEAPVTLDTGQPYPQRELLQMHFEVSPSLEWHQSAAGNTVLTMHLSSDLMGDMDLGDVVQAARAMFDDFKAHSRGPLTRYDLRDLGHPYGYGAPDEPPTWEKLGRPREVPRFPQVLREGQLRRVSLGHVRGMRGSVPTMSVVNRDTREFERSWRWTYSVRGDGLTLVFWNERKSERGSPISWFLAHGTIWMQAHGPWEVVPTAHWPQIVNAWRTAAQRAALGQRRDAGTYGAEEMEE